MISKVSFKDLHEAPNFNDLLEEYIDESANPLLPSPKYQVDTYYALESAGVLHCLASYTQDSVLSGFLTLIVTPMPHYGAIIAASESYFVGGAYRQSGAGLKLLDAAEDLAKELGAAGVLVSAPVGGKLEEVLPRAGYAHTNQLFFRGVS